jgi:hypothetical protein
LNSTIIFKNGNCDHGKYEKIDVCGKRALLEANWFVGHMVIIRTC